VVLPTIPADVPIWAVALGPAALSAALSAIASSRPGGAYFSVASDEDIYHLHEVYASLQALASGSAMLGLSSVDLAKGDTATVETDSRPACTKQRSPSPGTASGSSRYNWSTRTAVDVPVRHRRPQ
jgi:hypothetical protein